MKEWKSLKKGIAGCVMAFAVALCSAAPAWAETDAQGGGWVQNGTALSWVCPDGAVLMDTVTPDGYYVNGAGIWQTESRTYLGVAAVLPDQFLSSSDVTDLRSFQTEITQLNIQVQQFFEGRRAFHLYADYIIYCKVSDGKETVLSALYRDAESGGWKVKISCLFGDKDMETVTAGSVDYIVLQYLLALFSHTPEYAADAIFQSWEGENLWSLRMETLTPVGDCMMTYVVEDGAAVYQLARRSPVK